MSQLANRAVWLTFLSVITTSVWAEMPERIVTIGGAATETVFALGGGDNVVAVDLSSTYPEEVRLLPQVGYIRNISPEGVLSLNPDLIVTTESLGPPAAKDMMKRMSVPTIWLPEPDSVDALESSLRSVGEILGTEAEAEARIQKLEENVQQAEEIAGTWPKKPRVLFLMQPPTASRPGMVAGSGTRAQSLIELAGGENAAGDVKLYETFSTESLIKTNPDVIIIGMSEGHGATQEVVDDFKSLPLLKPVKAAQNSAIYGVPLDDLNFGPRLGDVILRWNGLIAPPQKAMN